MIGVVWDKVAVMIVFFFFSSRRRHTRCLSDWSSDVCSSDLAALGPATRAVSVDEVDPVDGDRPRRRTEGGEQGRGRIGPRSEERRVGKEGRSRWSPYH